MKEKPLSGIAKKVFDDLTSIYKLDDSALYLARIIAVCWDHLTQAEAMLEKDGLVVQGRYGGQLVAHPANDIVKSNRNQIMRALRQLNLTPLNSEMDQVLKDFQ